MKEKRPKRKPREGRQFALSDDINGKIDYLAAWRDITRSELVRRLVDAEWEREGGKQRSNRS